MLLDDTIVAVASPPGRSARALIRLSGPSTFPLLSAVLAAPPASRAAPARLRLGAGLELPLLLLTFRAPSSYTGEDAAELCFPGNPSLVSRVLDLLVSTRLARHAEPGEFSARAYLRGKLTLEQAEGIAATISAENADQLTAASSLLSGGTGARYRDWADEITSVLALVEAGIDFTDQEDVVAISPERAHRRLSELSRAIDRDLGGRTPAELRSALPVVALTGAPNAGKSTLFNALLAKRRAIASPTPGTTRDALREPLDLSHDAPAAGTVLLVDTPGIGESAPAASPSDAGAQSMATSTLADADLILHCDPTARFAPLAAAPAGIPVLRVITKADIAARSADPAAIPVCALDGWNLPKLRHDIAACVHSARSAGAAALLPRHRRALTACLSALEQAIIVAQPADPPRNVHLRDPELLADHLRTALDHIAELVGRTSPDDILARVFSSFCVGK